MRVLLVNEAEYEFNTANLTQIPFESFKLLKDDSVYNGGNTLPRLRVFKNMGELNRLMLTEDLEDKFNTEAGVFLSLKGNIFLFEKQEAKVDGTANTEENQGEQA